MQDEFESIEKALGHIPAGTIALKRHSGADVQSPYFLEQFISQTEGKGRIESFLLFPGIALSLHQYLGEQVQVHHAAKNYILEINHCHKGRIGWNMRDGAAVYLGAGDVCLHSIHSCADSQMGLPLGYYAGISLLADLSVLEENCPAVLKEGGFSSGALYEKFCRGAKPCILPAGCPLDSIFTPLYALQEQIRLPYYKLKALEVLLYLLQLEPLGLAGEQYGSAQQVEVIKEVRNFLIENLGQRFTIETLARKFLLNTSTLKAAFKAVYGMPIAAYVKEYRMQQAMKLLRQSHASIASIAQQVGYETQGKFTKAFKEKTGLLPTEYRKLYQK